jgi:ketosteroid isomerase-like protein
MSLHNIELHRRVVEAFNARDIEAFIGFADPGIELHSAFAAVGGAVYHGHDGLRQWHRDFEDAWADVHAKEETYFDRGDDVLAFYTLRGRGRRSGVEVEMANALVATWSNGTMTHFRVFAHREDALAELGLTEDQLEAIDV